jgi:hypothetical protein
MASLLVFKRVYRLEIQSVMLVFRHSFVNYCPSNLLSSSPTLPLPPSHSQRTVHIQGARGIVARFLKWSPAFAGKIKGTSTGESDSSHCQNNPRRMREDGE